MSFNIYIYDKKQKRFNEIGDGMKVRGTINGKQHFSIVQS